MKGLQPLHFQSAGGGMYAAEEQTEGAIIEFQFANRGRMAAPLCCRDLACLRQASLVLLPCRISARVALARLSN